MDHHADDYPTYGMVEAAFFLRLPYPTVREWVLRSGILSPQPEGLLSFNHLLELHVLKALRKVHRVSMQRIRSAVEEYKSVYAAAHPLLDSRFETDGVSLLLHDGDVYLNLSAGKQLEISEIVSTYMKRIAVGKRGVRHFYPFIIRESENEPMSVEITPTIAFGKPVVTGTGIQTEVIAGRFLARDSITDLAREYDLPEEKIEEALRWELPKFLNAAA